MEVPGHCINAGEIFPKWVAGKLLMIVGVVKAVECFSFMHLSELCSGVTFSL